MTILETVYSYLEKPEKAYILHRCSRYDLHGKEIMKTPDDEVDFVVQKQNDRLYVQVTQEIKSEKTEKREYERLLEIRDNYPKYVLRTDEFAGGNYQGIKSMHIADFLLCAEY